MTDDNQTPQDALASITAARAGIVKDTRYPLSWDLGYGAICGAMVGGQALPTLWAGLVLVFAMAGLVLATQAWRKEMGYWVNGYSPRRARWVAIGLAVVLIALMGVSLWFRFNGMHWGGLITFALGFTAAVVGGRLWMRTWKAELAEEGQ